MCSVRYSHLFIRLFGLCCLLCLFALSGKPEKAQKGKYKIKGEALAFRYKSINWWSCNYSAVALVSLVVIRYLGSSVQLIRKPRKKTRPATQEKVFLFLNQNFFPSLLYLFIYLLHGVGRLNDVHPSDFGRGV